MIKDILLRDPVGTWNRLAVFFTDPQVRTFMKQLGKGVAIVVGVEAISYTVGLLRTKNIDVTKDGDFIMTDVE
jgi:hypothetical protein